MTIYDEVFYEDEPFPNTHPQILAGIGLLYGMKPRSPENCRFLELGAAKGNNIIAMAQGLPKSEFVGIDLSQNQVDTGKALIKSLGTTNVSLIKADILEIGLELGKFDYIIAHGVLSWVPEDVRNKLFKVCSNLLSDNGICYLSYNTYPGWKARDIFRDIMTFESKNTDDLTELVKRSRRALALTSALLSKNETSFAKHLKAELTFYLDRPDWYYLHDFMAENNQPFYFSEISKLANENNLQYFADTELSMCSSDNLGKEAHGVLENLKPDLVSFEQYSDIARLRSFRRSLFCHKQLEVNRSFSHNIFNLHLAANLEEKQSKENHLMTKFIHSNGGSVVVPDLAVKHAFRTLIEAWPKAFSVKEMLSNLKTLSFADEEIKKTQMLLVKAIFANILEVRSSPGLMANKLTEAPRTTKLVMSQAEAGVSVTNLNLQTLTLTELERRVVKLLDGKKTKAELLEILKKLGKDFNLNDLDIILNNFIKNGLLIS